jgi:hypothetical protein
MIRNRQEFLLQSARDEFELARYEQNPEIVAKLIFGGRSALEEIQRRVHAKATGEINPSQQ